MSRVAIVLSVERVSDEGGHGVDVKCDPNGGDFITAHHYADPGEDSLPLPGDSIGLSASSDSEEHGVSYADTRNAGITVPGEKRIYARDNAGNVVGSLYLRGDGTAELACASLVIKGDVRIEGKLDTTGEVTAKAGSPQAVALTTHTHLTPIAPTQPPTPGT
jgi:hypothetical protein